MFSRKKYLYLALHTRTFGDFFTITNFFQVDWILEFQDMPCVVDEPSQTIIHDSKVGKFPSSYEFEDPLDANGCIRINSPRQRPVPQKVQRGFCHFMCGKFGSIGYDRFGFGYCNTHCSGIDKSMGLQWVLSDATLCLVLPNRLQK